ncbi:MULTISPECIES: hypothetical protein [Microbacterium]|uniref:DUF3137 domain-containing protein n=1 Tax=Microbacterium wangchenii TaxID=2541726 RepID=A0ABX5SP71_9MICO|nr:MULTISPECIES: hypothetical protein [Microbacterium]MCK6066607.1 hypothetical protein [Microbacterium sp. EYE_512]QBR87941.1 hypothetical protein E4K62_04070 [Microbacterium wangchenii]TFV83936.1 hypothetical protein E4V99_02315 [Microbacterium sp. dk485]TXK18269.1 hypothetical protein FVP99_06730 [Microbacterium wangchenii]
MTESAPAERLTEAVAFDADRGQLRAALRRNTVYVAVYLALVALVGAGIVALAMSGIGRLATYFLLSIFLLVLLASVVLGLRLRRRLQTFLRAGDPLLLLSPHALVFAGIPPIPWADVLGVVYCDERANLSSGGGIGRWMKRLTYRAGGSQVTLVVGVARPKRFREGAAGGLTRYLSSSFDLGGFTLPVDTALSDVQLRALAGSFRALAEGAIVRYLETDDARRVGRAAASMATGRPMRRDA